MKKSRRTYNGVHLNKKSNTQDVVEQSLTVCACRESSRCPVWYGEADSQFRTVYVIHTVQTESGTPQPGFGCGLLHRTTYSPG